MPNTKKVSIIETLEYSVWVEASDNETACVEAERAFLANDNRDQELLETVHDRQSEVVNPTDGQGW